MQSACGELSVQDQELLKAYHHSFDDEKVDLDLIMHLLFNICQSSDEGEIEDDDQGFCFSYKRPIARKLENQAHAVTGSDTQPTT